MEKVCEFDICTGCGVCSVVCPKQCISFIEGDFGQILPKVDTSTCIDCKKCERACPALKNNDKNYPLHCHAAFIKDLVDYQTTTSGGAAQALSLLILQAGGCVYGCATLPGANVEHIKVKTPDQLELLKGSKYVQSKAWPIYQDLQNEVKSGRKTLFIGTPCQCAAIKSLFNNKIPENLLIVDLICHGVPSMRFLQTYLQNKGVKLTNVNRLQFRNDNGFQLTAFDRNGNQLYSSQPLFSKIWDDIYYGTFFNGLSYRHSCYTCQFAQSERCGDITIGDFWGLGRNIPTREIPHHDKGISVILSNTSKGQRMVNRLSRLMNIYDRPISEAIQGNDQLRHPKHRNWRNHLFNCIRKWLGVSIAFRIVSADKTAKLIIKKYIFNRK